MVDRIEPYVWKETVKLLCEPATLQRLFFTATEAHSDRTRYNDLERMRAKNQNLVRQLESLTERLAELPKGVSAALLYAQMAKIEVIKREEDERIKVMEHERLTSNQMPSQLTSLDAFEMALERLYESREARDVCARIIHMLFKRIDVFPNDIRFQVRGVGRPDAPVATGPAVMEAGAGIQPSMNLAA